MPLIESRNIETLKITNCVITSPITLTNTILEIDQIKCLKLVTNNAIIAPFPSFVMSDLALNLIYFRNLSIKKLTFTIDHNPRVSYSTLKYLKHLEELNIYYSIQNCNANLERLIYHAASLKRVKTTFIEYIEHNKFFNLTNFKSCERKSQYYKSVIESMDNYMKVIATDYGKLRNQLTFK